MEDEIQLLDALVHDEAVPAAAREPALTWLLAPPTRAEWAAFLHTAGLAFGTASVLAGVLYLVAFNWAELGIFSRLLAVYATLAAAGAVAIRAGPRTLVGQLGAAAAAVLAGAGLVVYSQVYQSGANYWVLFASWSALALPFVLAARTPPLWALWIVLLDLTVATGVGSLVEWEWVDPITLVLAAVALVHLGVAEIWRGSWLRGALQLVAVGTLVVLAGGFLEAIEGDHGPGLPIPGGLLALVVVPVWAAAVQVQFARGKARMALALLAYAAVAALVSVEVAMRIADEDAAFLTVGATLFALTAGGFWWLRTGSGVLSARGGR